ncbi:MAG TPA: hypothetical protein VJO35_02805 [Terriglobales bacterium]|nr:hypothetical protein [Terriglobales bacterium]
MLHFGLYIAIVRSTKEKKPRENPLLRLQFSRVLRRIPSALFHISARRKNPLVFPGVKSAETSVSSDLSDAEKDFLSHMKQGCQPETDSLGGNPVLYDPKGGDTVRSPSANRGTVEALEKRGLIARDNGGEPLTIAWRMKKKPKFKCVISDGQTVEGIGDRDFEMTHQCCHISNELTLLTLLLPLPLIPELRARCRSRRGKKEVDGAVDIAEIMTELNASVDRK